MTPAIRLCKQRHIAIEVHSFHHDPHNTHFGAEAAAALGIDPERIFKTLMVAADARTFALGIVPVTAMLDLKLMAAAMGVKKVAMADGKVVQSRSGYLLGGVSPLAHKKPCPLFLDDSAEAQETILVSGGKRGLDIEIAPADLLMLTQGQFAPLMTQQNLS